MANILILYSLKTPENRFSGVFRKYKMGALARNELKNHLQCLRLIYVLICFSNVNFYFPKIMKKHSFSDNFRGNRS